MDYGAELMDTTTLPEHRTVRERMIVNLVGMLDDAAVAATELAAGRQPLSAGERARLALATKNLVGRLTQIA